MKEEDMNKPVYDSIGVDYTKNRSADPRITREIATLLDLPPGSIIADIGAGVGNYSNALADLGYDVKAVEPSKQMREQATPSSHVQWLEGAAESIPLPANSVHGVIAILSIHHFASIRDAASEFHRILPTGPVVIFTLDPREGEPFWFRDYFPEIYDQGNGTGRTVI